MSLFAMIYNEREGNLFIGFYRDFGGISESSHRLRGAGRVFAFHNSKKHQNSMEVAQKIEG